MIIDINTEKCRSVSYQMKNMEKDFRLYSDRLTTVRQNLSTFFSNTSVLDSIINIEERLEVERRNLNALQFGLIEVINAYIKTEKIIMDIDFPNINKTTNQKQTDNKSDEEKMINSLMSQYGFDKGAAETMVKLYKGLKAEYGDDTDQIFFALLASYTYGTIDGIKDGAMWGIIADIPPNELLTDKFYNKYGLMHSDIEHLKTELQVQHMLSADDSVSKWEAEDAIREKVNPILEYTYGLTYDELPQKLKDAMISKYQNYGDKPDFTHMCATTATILNNSDIKGLGTFAGKFNGIYDVDKNAGYVGDVYGTAGATPSFGNDDYMSDLDAVNIATRIKNGEDAMSAINDYYSDIESGKTTRANEFLANIGDGNANDGLAILISEEKTNSQFIEDNDYLKNDNNYMEKRDEAVGRFLRSLLEDSNILLED